MDETKTLITDLAKIPTDEFIKAAFGQFDVDDAPIRNENDCLFIYHRSIGFPKNIVIPNRMFHLEYTTHAKQRAAERISGLMVLPTVVRLTDSNLIEIHSDDNRFIKKAIVRINYNKYKDLILVLDIHFELFKAAVITLYYNNRNQSFESLDKTRYNKSK